MLQRSMRWTSSFPLVLLLLEAGPTRSEGPAGAAPGVVAEAVAGGSAAAKAGMQPGDVIVSWRRASSPPANPEPAQGPIASPFDLTDVEVEQAPRGPITLAGRRGDSEMTWTLAPGPSGLAVRPPLETKALALYEEGKALAQDDKAPEAAARWRLAAKGEGQELVALWFLARAGKALDDAALWSQADAPYEEAIGLAAQGRRAPRVAAQLLRQRVESAARRADWARAGDFERRALELDEAAGQESLAVARDLHALGRIAWGNRDLAAADAYYARALALRQKLAPDSLDLAGTLNNMGLVAGDRGDLAAAEELYRRALVVRERVVPGSLDVAGSFNNLGMVLHDRGDLAAAEEHYRAALAIREKLAPEGLDVAASLTNLGILARARGDLAAAEEHHRRALAIKEKLVPDTLELANGLDSLANAVGDRGDLVAAEAYARRAFEIRRRLAPGTLDVAMSLHNLGVLARTLGDPAAAEDHFRRALAIREKVAPASLDAAMSHSNLGEMARQRGDLAAAEQYQRRALAIVEKLAPGGLDVASSLNNLGAVLGDRGDLVAAEEYYRRALAIREKLAPGGLDVSESLHNLGMVARDRGDLVAAEGQILRAFAIRQKLAPGSATEAESLHELGLVYRRRGRLDAAAARFEAALDALESQQTKLGGTEESKSGFAAQYRAYYHDAAEALVDLDQAGGALHVLERSRARSLLALLAERHVPFSADLPPELARAQALADAEYDRTAAQLSDVGAGKDEAEVQKLLGGLRELRRKQEEIASRIRQASPHFASLRYPEPLDLDGVRKALDPGTLLLSYSVGADKALLLAAQPAGVAGPGVFAFRLPIGEGALRQRVDAFRRAIQRPGPGRQAALAARAAELYDLLVRPAEAQVGTSERVLLCLDGPLHSLPFAALVRREAGKAQAAYLVEWKPVHVVPSVTVYAELKKPRRTEGGTAGSLVAFGDPRYPAPAKGPAEPAAGPAVHEITRGFALTPLPFTRREVASIARLFPGRGRQYLGQEATEERAKALDKDARYVHFACHGYLDERFPLNSALALTIPERSAEGQDNGLLQAWEIFDKVRIDADLVTLSACNTALGKEMGGEGLLGLTRAFHYAGAQSVLATLWGVSDTSTALFMERFYAYLQAGKSRDQALRAAQLDFVRGRGPVRASAVPHLSHPFRWAAYQLSGDWR